jgi:predicted dehydrogenase
MSAVAGSPGPRFRLLGLAGAFEKHGLDPQEAQLSAGLDPGDPAYGLEPAERWGVLARGEADRRPVETARGDYASFYRGVADAVREGAPAPVSVADAVQTLELLEAAAASARTGAIVSTAT